MEICSGKVKKNRIKYNKVLDSVGFLRLLNFQQVFTFRTSFPYLKLESWIYFKDTQDIGLKPTQT